MARKPRISPSCSDEQIARYQSAASREIGSLNDWVRSVLDAVADSGVTVMELRDLLNNATEGKRK